MASKKFLNVCSSLATLMNLLYGWQPTYNWQKLVKKKRFHVSYLCTFALRFLSHIYYYRQSQFTLKSLTIFLCDLPSDHGVVWACGLAEEEWVDSGDAVGSCVPCCYPEDALFYLLLDQALFGGGVISHGYV